MIERVPDPDRTRLSWPVISAQWLLASAIVWGAGIVIGVLWSIGDASATVGLSRGLVIAGVLGLTFAVFSMSVRTQGADAPFFGFAVRATGRWTPERGSPGDPSRAGGLTTTGQFLFASILPLIVGAVLWPS
jgi:hypothetical protein